MSWFKFGFGGSGYDAVKEKNRREAPTGILRSEDAELPNLFRKKLLSASRDIHRNFSIAAWLIRKHLDFVSTFNFQARSGNDKLDAQLQKLVTWWSKPFNFDVTSRFGLQKFIRLSEMRRTVDGDVFLLKLKDGRVQAIEGDRIRTPDAGIPPETGYTIADFIHGIRTDPFGKPVQYSLCKRGKVSDAGGFPTQFIFERLLDAKNVYQFGYFDRFDQVRGVSPFAAAINTLRDTYEAFDYALAKMKVSQLFALSVFREKSAEMGSHETILDGASDSEDRYNVDFGRGPIFMDLDPGDRAEFLETKTPSTEFKEFSETMIGVALKALDIPYSFYAENFTNYSGCRQALLQYELAAKIKRVDLQALLDSLTAWRISLWIQDGLLKADIRDLSWEWVPTGVSWIDPMKEVQANILAVAAGLDTRTDILKEQGKDFYAIAATLASEQILLKSLGLSVNTPTQVTETENAVAA